MRFGIFIFRDNHPGLGRSNQKFYEEVLTKLIAAPDPKYRSWTISRKSVWRFSRRQKSAVAILREYEKLGVTYVIGIVNFGGVPMTDVRRKFFPSSGERLSGTLTASALALCASHIEKRFANW
jgi:hypothetical protein